MKAFIASLEGSFDDGPATPVVSGMRLNMSNFGGFSKKPLTFVGTWRGIIILEQLQNAIVPFIPASRQLVQLTEERGRWRTPCFPIREGQMHALAKECSSFLPLLNDQCTNEVVSYKECSVCVSALHD